jgi:hypothetical protein
MILYFGLSGLLIRASGILLDYRLFGYEAYYVLSFNTYVSFVSDCLDRYLCRFNEFIESSRIIYLCLFNVLASSAATAISTPYFPASNSRSSTLFNVMSAISPPHYPLFPFNSASLSPPQQHNPAPLFNVMSANTAHCLLPSRPNIFSARHTLFNVLSASVPKRSGSLPQHNISLSSPTPTTATSAPYFSVHPSTASYFPTISSRLGHYV